MRIVLTNCNTIGSFCCRWLLGIFVFLAVAAKSSAQETPREILGSYRYLRHAVLPESNNNSSVSLPAIRLDSTFYARINDLSNDVLLLDQQGNALQFVLNRVTGNTTIWREEPLSGRVVQSQLLPDGKSILEFELDGNINLISSIEISQDTFPAGSHLTIAVGTNTKLQEVITDYELADLSQIPEISSRRLPLPEPVQGKLIRFTLTNASFSGQESVRVYTPISKEQPETPLISEYPVNIRKIDNTSKWLFLELDTANQPLTQLKINTSTPFFLCSVFVFGSSDRMKWTQLAHTTIHHIGMDIVNTVDFPEFRGQYIQVQIKKNGTEALQDVQIQSFGNTYEWLLSPLDNADTNLTIYYGSVGRTPQQQQASGIVSGQTRSFFELSTEQQNPLSRTGIQDLRTWRYIAGALLILLSGITVWSILFSLKKNSRVLPED